MTNQVSIITNHHWHDFIFASEVPKKVWKDQFDHLDPDEASDMFFKYRNCWYHISDFMRIDAQPADDPFKDWDGYAADSAFSGVLLKVSRHGDQYMVGTYST